MAYRAKTTENDTSVAAFIADAEPEERREECEALCGLMSRVTGEPAKMWGKAIVGFGSYHYKYASGHEGEAALVGFSPRKGALSIYIMQGFSAYPEIMKNLGKYKTGKSCLYVKKLDDIDLKLLQKLVKESVAWMRKTYPD